jgi:phosphatidate cytidylyltransferase
MLKQRIITALILAAVFLAALFYLPIAYFTVFLALVVLVGAWEWANLASWSSAWQRYSYVAVIAVLMALIALYLGFWPGHEPSGTEPYQRLILLGCAWWALALLLVQGYPSSAILWGSTSVRLLMGVMVLIPTWIAFVYVRSQPGGAWLVLLIVAIVACADIGGYFVGRRWGKHKLKPAVSPGKTWEGFVGGLLANVLLAIVLWQITGNSLITLLALILPTSLFSVLGDLLESMVKRQRGIKDSSALLPGHGGVLDRMDSLTAAAPVFALALIASGGVGG